VELYVVHLTVNFLNLLLKVPHSSFSAIIFNKGKKSGICNFNLYMFVAEPLSQYIDNKVEPELKSLFGHFTNGWWNYVGDARIWILYKHQVYNMLALFLLIEFTTNIPFYVVWFVINGSKMNVLWINDSFSCI